MTLKKLVRKRVLERTLAAPQGEKARMPHAIKPMLATLVNAPFDRAGWIFEVKWDGFRAIAEVEKGRVQLYSRNQKSFNERFSPIVSSLEELGHNAVLDGEVVIVDSRGRSHFQLLQNYHRTQTGTLVYYVFDLLYLDGRDLRDLPLLRRKEILTPLLQRLEDVRASEHVEESGVSFYQAAARQELEGMIAKDGASPYREGIRTESWLKVKARKQQEVVIGGYTAPRGSRHGLGSLVIGVYEKGKLVSVGHAGGGFNEKSLTEMRSRLDPLVQSSCPFEAKPKTNAPVTWVKPALVCEVVFQEWTDEGTMRQPIFLGMREDKSPRAVKRELPESVTEVLPRASKRRKASRPSPTD